MKMLVQAFNLGWMRLWLLFNILDLVTTYKVVGAEGTEGNWLLAQLMGVDFGLMCFVKLVMAGVVGLVLVKMAKVRLLKILSIALGVMVMWNLAIWVS